MSEDLIASKSYLIVDDEAFSRAVVAKMLKGLGATKVAQAVDGVKAMEDLSGGGGGVECVIADFNMPNMNGLQLLKAVRCGRNGAPRDIPFIMLTGNADRDVVGFAIQLDVNAFIVKPGSKGTLKSRLERVFTEKRALKAPERYEAVAVEAFFDTRVLSEADRESLLAAEEAKVLAAMREKPGAPDGMEVPFNEVRVGDVLVEDIVINNIPIFASGAKLTDSAVAKLLKLADLAELLGPIGSVRVRRAA